MTALSAPAALGRAVAQRRRRPTPAADRTTATDRTWSARVGPTPASDAPTLDTVGARWWSAFDAAETAVRAADIYLAAPELGELNARLSTERSATVELLEDVARDEGVRATFSNIHVSRSSLRALLGLPPEVTACVFNLDGVLIGSAALHAAAWAETLDEFIDARVERTRGRFAPFDRRTDYQRHFHGRPRRDGIREFLAGRGIALREGDPSDRPGAETVYGLANRKQLVLLRRLEEEGVRAFEGSRRYLEAARDAGLRSVGVSASANIERFVERAGLSSLIGLYLDGNAILARGLPARPAPDILLAACDLVGVVPAAAAMFETSAAGVEAARAAGFRTIVAVDSGDRAELLAGADVVVTDLAELIERNLRVLATSRH